MNINNIKVSILLLMMPFTKALAQPYGSKLEMMNEMTTKDHTISVILTWAIGLAPPLIIRYAIVKRPLSRLVAITVCFVFVILELSVLIEMDKALYGRTYAYPVVSIIAFISYFILRTGSNSVMYQKQRKIPKSAPIKKQQNSVAEKVDDERLFYTATVEFENDALDNALWAKAIALSEGDVSTAKYKYIKLRVDQLKNAAISSELNTQEYDVNEPDAPITSFLAAGPGSTFLNVNHYRITLRQRTIKITDEGTEEELVYDPFSDELRFSLSSYFRLVGSPFFTIMNRDGEVMKFLIQQSEWKLLKQWLNRN